jgi:spore coat protein U-like protein
MSIARPLIVALVLSAIVGMQNVRAFASGCEINASPIVFGSYDSIHTADLVTVGTLTLSCSGVHGPVKIELTAGDSHNFRQRVMHLGNSQLGYNLYIDATATSVWGDGSAGSQAYTIAAPADGAVVRVAVYGRAQSRQDAIAGAYRDNVSVTLTF